MKRRWPLGLLLLCWLLILLAPPLRRMFWIQASGRGEFYRGWMWGPFPGAPWDSGVLPPGETSTAPTGNWEAVAARCPDDARVLAVAIEQDAGAEEALKLAEKRAIASYVPDHPRFPPFPAGRMRAYDALIQQFPSESWLLARRLQQTIGTMYTDRLGGEFSEWDDARARRHQSPERAGKPNYTSQQMREAIALARRGQKLEPDNAFFDWALFCLLIMDWRDREAWPVLEQASHKPRFDAHQREWEQALFAAHEAKWGRRLLAEEAIYVHASHTFPASDKERDIGRIAAWEGRKAGRGRGDHARALQIYASMARLQSLRALHGYSYDEEQLALTMIAQAFMVEGRVSNTELTQAQKYSSIYRARLSSARFAHYAAKHGRPDLAREMAGLRREAGVRQARIRQPSDSAQLYWGMQKRPLVAALCLYWSAGALLLLLPPTALAWLVLGALLQWAGVPQLEINRRWLGWMLLCSACAFAACAGYALYAGDGWRTILCINYFDDKWRSGFDTSLLDRLLAGGAAAALCVPLLFAAFCRCHRPPLATGRASLRQCVAGVRPMPMLLTSSMLSVLLAAVQFWFQLLTRAGYQFWIPDILRQIISFLIGDFRICVPAWAPAWGAAAIFGALMLFPLRWIFTTATGDKPHAAYRLRLLHRSFGALAIAASVGYLILLIVSVPLRARLDRQIEQQVQRGEVALKLENSSP